MNFIEKLTNSWSTSGSLLCVGLEPDPDKLPEQIRNSRHPFFEFDKAIIDATGDLVCAYKPQIAYYAAYGAEQQLLMTFQYLQERCPQVVTILDAKRGDIGSTCQKYAAEAFDRYQADAVTVNPYLGTDSLEPFLNRHTKGVIILCRTSNPGGADFQELSTDGQKLYRVVASKAASQWNYNGNVALVVGATYPHELKEVREIVEDMPLLVPGIGAQGGDVRAAVSSGLNRQGTGMIINSSRAILYASSGSDFADRARQAALAIKNEINEHRSAERVSP